MIYHTSVLVKADFLKDNKKKRVCFHGNRSLGAVDSFTMKTIV